MLFAGGRSYSSSGSEFPESSMRVPGQPGLASKLITLPISIISGSLGLISGAIGLGLWAAGGVLSYSLSVVRLGHGRNGDSSSSTTPLVSVSAVASEAMEFIAGFERNYGLKRPNFVSEGFMDALQRSKNEFKLLFNTLFVGVGGFVNENFVSWGGSIRARDVYGLSGFASITLIPKMALMALVVESSLLYLQYPI
ncbi:hypothetical protein F8388_008733 [Cannabis sativa]|uniref:Uncharacterized protein n=1 Tax=Cannabis sativa TaxID=3483 RepID=A0A7J6HK52_CANSA|nr:hypothetical protein F8388_008733 [Cannabis sativa]